MLRLTEPGDRSLTLLAFVDCAQRAYCIHPPLRWVEAISPRELAGDPWFLPSPQKKSSESSIYARRALRRCRGHSALGTPGTRRARAHIIATGSERRLRAADDAPHHHCMCCDFLVLLLAFALATRLSGCLHYQPCGMVVQQEVVRAVLWLGSPLAPLLRASPNMLDYSQITTS